MIKKISKKYQKNIKKIPKKYQKNTKKISKIYQKYIKKISKNYQKKIGEKNIQKKRDKNKKPEKYILKEPRTYTITIVEAVQWVKNLS